MYIRFADGGVVRLVTDGVSPQRADEYVQVAAEAGYQSEVHVAADTVVVQVYLDCNRWEKGERRLIVQEVCKLLDQVTRTIRIE